ncbi:MAG TPA: protein-glutamate O-methyltransferase CheR, partial [Geobacteraceae bacterium]|nr:protein-glutamate O-methyltransferase CheR [Geobacteraceae bacterium]
MTHRISDQLLAKCSDFITTRFGLHFPKKRWRDLERGILCAAGELGFTDTADCIRWLISAELTRDQLDTLAGCLTIGETYFFRERNSFDALEKDILPALLSSRRGKDQRLRIWSAGCSTGEEPYSIAIMLHRMIADLPKWNITILATDINPASLRKAGRGEYGDWSFRGVPDGIKAKYFTSTQEGKFAISDVIKKMVTFAPLNLAEDPYPSLVNNTNALDLILCRNVLMYFSSRQMKTVLGKFYHSLVTGGWLVVSPCETSHTLFSEYASVPFHNVLFYRKGHEKAASVPLEAAGGKSESP